MKLESGEIGVVALDADGYEIGGIVVFDSLKRAKAHAISLMASEELLAAGMFKTEVRNSEGECLADYFV